MAQLELCAVDAIADPGSRGFELPGDDGPLRLFVVRRDGALYAYRNRCPHTGAPMEWRPHVFLSHDEHFIQCALHGALFAIEDGRCLRGPCSGVGLEPIAVAERDGRVVIERPD